MGKTGQIAKSIVQSKIDDCEILAAGRDDCDIGSLDEVSRTITHFQPDFIVNAAAYTAVDKAEEESDEAFRINRDGAKNIAIISADLSVPMVHFSTDYVFDGSKSKPYTENDSVGPTGIYGESKLAGEVAVRKNNPKHIILRTAWVYSAFGNNFLKTMLRLAENRDELTIVADQFGNPSDAKDMANGVIKIIKQYRSKDREIGYGTYHFCGPNRMHWADFARAIFAESRLIDGNYATVKNITTEDYPTPARRPANSSLDCSKFEAEFGYESIPFQESVRATLKSLSIRS